MNRSLILTAGAWLVLAVVLAAMLIAVIANRYDPPSIANVDVPSGLHCQEDETIFWTDVDTLGCVHAEQVD